MNLYKIEIRAYGSDPSNVYYIASTEIKDAIAACPFSGVMPIERLTLLTDNLIDAAEYMARE